MAKPIVVVKENPGTLVVTVVHNRKTVAEIKLPEVKIRLGDKAKVNGKDVEVTKDPTHGRCYKVEIDEAPRLRGRRKAKKKKRRPSTKAKSGK